MAAGGGGRWELGSPWVLCRLGRAAVRDLEAVSLLDEVRTADLTLSRTNLGSIEPELEHGCRLSL